MTAAHCTRGSTNFQVIAGEHDLNVDMQTDQATRHDVASTNDHPQYNQNNQDNDFSILELVQAIDLSSASNAKAACMPTLGDGTFASGTKFVVSGWGRKTNGFLSDVLHHVTVPWVSDAICRQSYPSQTITNQMICAGDVNNGRIDSCQGDSGGPLTVADAGKTKLIGVVSWGIGCGVPGRPGVYAEVTSVLSWVQGIIGDCNSATECGIAPPTPPPSPSPCGDNSPLCGLFRFFGLCQFNNIANACMRSCGRC